MLRRTPTSGSRAGSSQAIAPHSEADPVALLLHVLVAIGNLIGRGCMPRSRRRLHPCNEFVALVGRTAKARKGQAWSTPRSPRRRRRAWAQTRIKTGLSSGEGLIYNVRDARSERQPVKERGRVVDYQEVQVDAGEPDKRLLVIEPELATVLRRMQGEGNTLSSILREAWDSGRLSTLTKNSPLRATGAHVSILAHITQEELVTALTETDRANGFANRFLFLLVKRSKVLPEGWRPGGGLAPAGRRAAGGRGVGPGAADPGADPEAPGRVGRRVPRPSRRGARADRRHPGPGRGPRPPAVADLRGPRLRADGPARASGGGPGHLGLRRGVSPAIFGERLGISDADTPLRGAPATGPHDPDGIRDLFGRNKRPRTRSTPCSGAPGGRGRSERPPPGARWRSGTPTETWEPIP